MLHQSSHLLEIQSNLGYVLQQLNKVIHLLNHMERFSHSISLPVHEPDAAQQLPRLHLNQNSLKAQSEKAEVPKSKRLLFIYCRNTCAHFNVVKIEHKALDIADLFKLFLCFCCCIVLITILPIEVSFQIALHLYVKICR